MMKILLKIAIVLCMSGFAMTSNAQSFEMLDIVKLMDKPAKPKTSGKKSKEVKNEHASVGVESAIPAEQSYSSNISDMYEAIKAEVSVADKLINVMPDTNAYKVAPSNRQREHRFHDKQKEPALVDPTLLLTTPAGRVD